MAHSKISFSIEIFNLDRNLEFVWSLGPLGPLNREEKSVHNHHRKNIFWRTCPYFARSPERFCEYFFVFAWEFCIEKWRRFLVNFFWSPSPTKRSTKHPRKFRGKFGAKFGAKFGTKIRGKIRETFVLQPFSDLTFLASKKNISGRWWIQKPYKNQENHIHHRNLSSVDPFFSAKKSSALEQGGVRFLFPSLKVKNDLPILKITLRSAIFTYFKAYFRRGFKT